MDIIWFDFVQHKGCDSLVNMSMCKQNINVLYGEQKKNPVVAHFMEINHPVSSFKYTGLEKVSVSQTGGM